jgi:transposase-like protein
MPQEFNSLIEVIEYFSDEQKCLNYLMVQRFDGAITCPHCGGSKIYCFSDGMRYKCSSCRQQFTAKVGTIFEGSKIPMKKWFTAIYLVTSHKKGVSSHQLARDIKVTQKTGWFMLHRIRFALGQGSFDMPLGGEGVIVESDTTITGGKVKNMSNKKRKEIREGLRGINDNKASVAGYIERSGTIKFDVIAPNESEKELLTKHVDTTSVLMTDSATTYTTVGKEFAHHGIVDHSKSEYVRDNVYHTNTIEGAFSLFDRMIIGIYHSVSVKHLQAYCNESAYRYNTRKMNEGNRVSLTVAKSNCRLTYSTLISK